MSEFCVWKCYQICFRHKYTFLLEAWMRVSWAGWAKGKCINFNKPTKENYFLYIMYIHRTEWNTTINIKVYHTFSSCFINSNDHGEIKVENLYRVWRHLWDEHLLYSEHCQIVKTLYFFKCYFRKKENPIFLITLSSFSDFLSVSKNRYKNI